MMQKTKANIPYAVFEYNGFFGDPILNNARLAPAIQDLYSTLTQWNIQPKDVKYRNPASAVESSVTLELANGRIAFNLSHSGVTLSVQNADWSQAELITSIIEGCLKTLDTAAGVKIKRHELQIMMTAIPEGKPLKEISKEFAVPWKLRPNDALDFCGVVLYTSRGMIVVDKAVANPEGIFVRIVRRFDATVALSDMVKDLNETEIWLGETLGLEF
jgi:hypothetical protein